MKRFIAAAIVGSMVFGSSVAFANTQTSANLSGTTTIDIAALQAQIAVLLKQIQELKVQGDHFPKSFSTTTPEGDIQIEINFKKRLRMGDHGDDVKHLQEFLSTDAVIFPEGKITGIFGPLTAKAVKRLQEKLGLEQVGEVGPKTLEKINEILRNGAGNSGMIPPGLLKDHGRMVVVPLKAQNDSGVMAKAVISAKSASTTSVMLMVSEEHANSSVLGTTTMPHPAHIHGGPCATTTIGAVKYPLSPVVNGRSETVLNVSLPDLPGFLRHRLARRGRFFAAHRFHRG
jgi:hypothetical protein